MTATFTVSKDRCITMVAEVGVNGIHYIIKAPIT